MCSWQDVSRSLRQPVTWCPRSPSPIVSTVGKQRELNAGSDYILCFIQFGTTAHEMVLPTFRGFLPSIKPFWKHLTDKVHTVSIGDVKSSQIEDWPPHCWFLDLLFLPFGCVVCGTHLWVRSHVCASTLHVCTCMQQPEADTVSLSWPPTLLLRQGLSSKPWACRFGKSIYPTLCRYSCLHLPSNAMADGLPHLPSIDTGPGDLNSGSSCLQSKRPLGYFPRPISSFQCF